MRKLDFDDLVFGYVDSLRFGLVTYAIQPEVSFVDDFFISGERASYNFKFPFLQKRKDFSFLVNYNSNPLVAASFFSGGNGFVVEQCFTTGSFLNDVVALKRLLGFEEGDDWKLSVFRGENNHFYDDDQAVNISRVLAGKLSPVGFRELFISPSDKGSLEKVVPPLLVHSYGLGFDDGLYNGSKIILREDFENLNRSSLLENTVLAHDFFYFKEFARKF